MSYKTRRAKRQQRRNWKRRNKADAKLSAFLHRKTPVPGLTDQRPGEAHRS